MKIQPKWKMTRSDCPPQWGCSNENENVFGISFWFFSLITRTTQTFSGKNFFIKMSCLHKYIKEIGKRLEENLPILWLLQERENVNYFFKKGRYDGDWSPNLVCNMFVQVSVKEWCWSESNSTFEDVQLWNDWGKEKRVF